MHRLIMKNISTVLIDI